MSKATDSWMSISDFNAIYEIKSKSHVHVVRHQYNPHWIKLVEIMFRKKPAIYVNTGFLDKVKAKRVELTEEAHELYYELSTLYGSTWALSRMLKHESGRSQESWNDWLSNRLFRPRNESFTILNTKINKRMIEFIRIARRIKRRSEVA